MITKTKTSGLIIFVMLLSACLLVLRTSGLAQLTEDEKNTIDIVKRTQNSVVYVTNIQLVRDFFSWAEEQIPRGQVLALSGMIRDTSSPTIM